MKWLNLLIAVYSLCINITAVCMTVYDKKAAVRHTRRIPEKNLMLTVLLGGGIGMYLTMFTIRHKTRHLKFVAGVPAITIPEIILFLLLILRFH